MHPSISSIPRDFLARFQLSPLLSFHDPATEQLYQRSAFSTHTVVLGLPLTLAAVACGQTWEWGILALALAYTAAVWLTREFRDIFSVCLILVSLHSIDPGGSSLLTPLSLCSLGTSYPGFLSRWRNISLLSLLNLFLSLGIGAPAQVTTYGAVLLLLFFLEKHKRELWARLETASVSERHIFKLISVQETGLVLSDLSGKVVYSNSAAHHYLLTYAPNHVLRQDTFGEALKEATEVETEMKLDVDEELIGVVARVRRVPWYGRNCVLVAFIETTEWVRTVGALTKVDTKVLNEVSTLERDANRRFRDTNDLSAQLDLCRLHTVLHEVNASLAYQRAMLGQYEGTTSGFNLRTEIVDTVELASAVAETKGLTVTLTFEPGVPSAVTGDRVAVGGVFRFAYTRLVEESNRGEQVEVRVRVSSASGDAVKVSVGLEAVTRGEGRLEQELKDVASRRSHDVEMSAFLTFLKSLRGDYSCNSNTADTVLARLSLHYDMAIQPDTKPEGRFQLPIVSHFRQDLTGDKCRWDYAEGLGGKEAVRKRYVKQNSRKTVRGLPVIETTPEVLLPIAETYSSEQLSEERGFPEPPSYVDRVLSEEDAQAIPLLSRPPHSGSSLEVPNELDGSSPLCRTLTRNHNDLRKVSSSRTTSPGSSPFSSSFRAL